MSQSAIMSTRLFLLPTARLLDKTNQPTEKKVDPPVELPSQVGPAQCDDLAEFLNLGRNGFLHHEETAWKVLNLLGSPPEASGCTTDIGLYNRDNRCAVSTTPVTSVRLKLCF